jgi:hypothetical protein
MPQSNPEIEKRLAALGERSEHMAVLLEIFYGQNERQRRELQELRAAIAVPGGAERTAQDATSEISADMLAGASGG